MNTMASRQLTKYLTSPSRIASALDWKKLSGAVLSMNIADKKIGLALASHPGQHEPVMKLPDIPLKMEARENKRVIKKEILQEIQDIAQKNKVCGIVVSWPVQKETGRMGRDCGATLHTLDALATESQVLTPNRPFCLWDGAHVQPEQDDVWGRAPRYGKQCTKEKHVASKEQYNQTAHLDAQAVWNDFCTSHWPEVDCVESQSVVLTDDDIPGNYRHMGEPIVEEGTSSAYARATLVE